MIRNVMEPVLEEIEGNSETIKIKEENDRIDGDMVRSNALQNVNLQSHLCYAVIARETENRF